MGFGSYDEDDQDEQAQTDETDGEMSEAMKRARHDGTLSMEVDSVEELLDSFKDDGDEDEE